MLSLTFNFISLGQDFLGEAFGEIPLDFVYLFVKGEISGRWIRWKS
jgi:hypothetical protein